MRIWLTSKYQSCRAVTSKRSDNVEEVDCSLKWAKSSPLTFATFAIMDDARASRLSTSVPYDRQEKYNLQSKAMHHSSCSLDDVHLEEIDAVLATSLQSLIDHDRAASPQGTTAMHLHCCPFVFQGSQNM